MPSMSPIAARDLPTLLNRRFEALIFDWDGTAVTDRKQDAGAVREVVESLCAAGVDVAVVSGTHLENIDGQLGARPTGPGRLLIAVNRGSELFEVDGSGPRLISRREASAAEDAALTRAADGSSGVSRSGVSKRASCRSG